MSLQHILAAEPEPPPPPPAPNAPSESAAAAMPPPSSLPLQEHPNDQPMDAPKADDAKDDEQMHTSTTTSTRRNASGNVSSVYSGNKVKHLKKEDGIPLWRKDIQYDFLRLVFYDETKCFTKYSDGTKDNTFADIYIDAMAKSSKCSKILKEKLLQDQEGAISMAMVCLLVNVGRMNTTLNFFPEMRAQLRTYHSIPALQAHQDPNAYKQLQDAPRLKSILKGATEDDPQPSTMEEIKANKVPRTNPVNLIFVMSQYAPKISEVHFQAPRDFFDLVMRGSLSSVSRARAFLWLIWWYLESDFGHADSQRNPFGAGLYGEGEEGTGALPLKVPALESLTEEQRALENVDTEDEKYFGEVKRKERIAILASEPSPAMTALKRARKEKGLDRHEHVPPHGSDDEASEAGWQKLHNAAATARASGIYHETPSEYTRSPSPPIASRGFQAVNAPPKPAGDMRINTLLNNDDAPIDASPPQAVTAPSGSSRKGPGRGNWRRNKPKQETVPLAVRGTETSHHVPLLPNTGHTSFIHETPHAQLQPATPGSGAFGQYSNGLTHLSPQHGVSISFQPPNNHIPTPSYQAQKRHRGITQHQSAVITHRKQQIDYTLDRRIKKVHARARDRRESEGTILRAWKRIRLMPTEYDSEEEDIKLRKERDRVEKEDDWRLQKNKELDFNEELEALRRPRVLFAGMTHIDGETMDVGEEARTVAQTFQRASRRLERWEESNLPGQAMIRRRQGQLQGGMRPQRRSVAKQPYEENLHRENMQMLDEMAAARRGGSHQQRSGAARRGEHRAISGGAEMGQKANFQPDDDDGGGELDEEDRELLGEVDADETEEDSDEEIGDD
ncbi:hypothetical protein LTR36_002325 [Oleoguttula mirabilis]|uniref:Ino eighty subunit 1 n=1 Tax=Oleoguttula mirabilis TaxID=1507867 RepID=A0AAV9JNR3_9PEZI|nr:hypothetical protein LTR36_002325 [Oleoguttula mirabilis]